MKKSLWMVFNAIVTIIGGLSSVKFLGGTTVVSAMDIAISITVYSMWIGFIMLVLTKSPDLISSAIRISGVLVIGLIMGISLSHSLLGIVFILPFMGLAEWQSAMLIDPIWFVILMYLVLLILIWMYVLIKRKKEKLSL